MDCIIYQMEQKRTKEVEQGLFEIIAPCILAKRDDFKAKVKKRIISFTLDLLRKWGVIRPHYVTRESVGCNKVTVDINRVDEMVYQCKNTLRCLYNQDVDMLVVGAREWSMLNSCREFYMPADYHSSIVHNGQRLQYHGIRVRIVPWFEGIIAIPRVKE